MAVSCPSSTLTHSAAASMPNCAVAEGPPYDPPALQPRPIQVPLTAPPPPLPHVSQVVTDRFAGPNLVPAGVGQPCNSLSNYCGGSWQGILSEIRYIQASVEHCTCSLSTGLIPAADVLVLPYMHVRLEVWAALCVHVIAARQGSSHLTTACPPAGLCCWPCCLPTPAAAGTQLECHLEQPCERQQLWRVSWVGVETA